jgi:hypothetical protein
LSIVFNLLQLALTGYAVLHVVRFTRRAWILENMLVVFGRQILKSGHDWARTVEDPMALEYLQRLDKTETPTVPPPAA